MSSKKDLEEKAAELAAHLAEDMAKYQLKGKTITLKLKLATFEVRTRALTLPCYVSCADEIHNTMLKLLSMELPVKIRLMGVRVSNFWENKRDPNQASLLSFVTRDGTEVGSAKDQPLGSDQVTKNKSMLGDFGKSSHPQTNRMKPRHSTGLTEAGLYSEGNSKVPMCKSASNGVPVMPAEHVMDALCPEGFPQKRCEVCGMDVDKLQSQEHEDLHLAIEIQKEDRRISKILERSPRICLSKCSKKRSSALGSLDAYLTKKN